MKYFNFNIGDWLPATTDLSGCEVGMYVRLLVWYYSHEQALPLTWKDLNRIALARTRADREAIQTVVRRFFTLTDDGWTNAKADNVLKTYSKGESMRTAKRSADAERQRVSRLRRDAKVAAAVSMGIQTPLSATIEQVDELLRNRGVTQVVTPDVTCDIAPVTPEVTRDLVRAPAINQEPIRDAAVAPSPASAGAHAREGGGVIVLRPLEPDRLASAIRALKAAGFPLAQASMADPRLLGALQAGCTDEQLRLAATEAVARAKSWGWLVATIAGRMADIAAGYGPGRAANARSLADHDRVAGLTPSIARKPQKPH